MDLMMTLLLLTIAVLLAALLAVRLTLLRKVQRMTDWMKRLAKGEEGKPPELPRRGILAPLAHEAAALAGRLAAAQEAAAQEARLRRLRDSLWTRERLREHVQAKLMARPLVLVANREPYRHVRRGGAVECQMPASGLVTGVEPILRACGGTWVAHGDGDADRQTADSDGRVKVPPEDPKYVLRRVWLTPQEEKGYYYGFANEGLWPLCHIAHTRPIFRPEDWQAYGVVNRKFARAALDEIEGLEEPFFLIQDYHFTLLPKLIKEGRPDARVSLFWHIPWPNPEAFGICPWQTSLLEGMLGADMIGFHTQYNCNNFLDTVDRSLQAHVDRERFAVTRGDHLTVVKPFPISVEFPAPASGSPPQERAAERERILREAGISAEFIAVGVDRLDYTKGILERFRGLERFLEKYPAYRGRFALFQLAAPSRGSIARYKDFQAEVEVEAARVNARFATRTCRPIVLLVRHHSHAEIRPYYRAADACVVTSLHDGMNLVAKEFAVARDDERGVLILSRFTGAARELSDALLVNPYDVDELAEALRRAFEMPEEERSLRMARLRSVLRENNIYRWAANLVGELAALRPERVPVH